MNKYMMAIQGIIVVGLLSLILIIYYGKQDFDLIEYQNNLESASLKYMSDHNMKVTYKEPQLIFTSELLENEYIKKIEEKYCIKSIVISKKLIGNNYVFNKDCE